MNKISYLLSGNNISLFFEGKNYTFERSSAQFNKVVDALKRDDVNALREVIDLKKDFARRLSSVAVFENDTLYVNGEPMHNAIEERLLDLTKNGLSLDPMLLFIKNLLKNPSSTSIEELYLFLENSQLPITSDGHFLAYKVVTNNYLDKHTRSIDNSVGKEVTMERSLVDPVRTNECSRGLHFCSVGYLSSFYSPGDKIMVVKINPADIVSIPVDYNFSKGRTWRYVVVDELKEHELIKPVYDSTYETHFAESDTDDFEDEDDSDDEEYDSMNEDFDDDADDSGDTVSAQPEKVVANALHPDTIEEVKTALLESYRVGVKPCLADIARAIGVSRRTVGRIRDRMRAASELPANS